MFIIYPDRVFFNHFFYVRRSHFVFLQTKSIQHDRLFHLGKLSCTRGNRIRSGSGLPSGAPKNPCKYLACKGFHVFMQKKGAVTQRPDLVSCATAPHFPVPASSGYLLFQMFSPEYLIRFQQFHDPVHSARIPHRFHKQPLFLHFLGKSLLAFCSEMLPI